MSANSIAQSEPVADLFHPIFAGGWRIRFAHRTFRWTSEAPKAAAVHCVIIGFDKVGRSPATLFFYEHVSGPRCRRPRARRSTDTCMSKLMLPRLV